MVLWYFIYLQNGTRSDFPWICSNLLSLISCERKHTSNLKHAAIWNNFSFPLNVQDNKTLYQTSSLLKLNYSIYNYRFPPWKDAFLVCNKLCSKARVISTLPFLSAERKELGIRADNSALLLSLSFHTSPFRFGFVSRVKLGFSTRSFLSTSLPTPVSPPFIPVSSRLFLFPFQLLVAGALSLHVIASTTWRLGIFQQMSELVISKQARLKESN